MVRGSTGGDTGMHTIVIRRRRKHYPAYVPRKLKFSPDVVRREAQRLLDAGYAAQSSSLLAEYGLS